MVICHAQSIIYDIIWNYKSHGESTIDRFLFHSVSIYIQHKIPEKECFALISLGTGAFD